MFGSHHVFGERHAPFFTCQEHSVFFHSYRFNECSLFLLLRLAFDFCLDFCSDLVISLHQGVFLPLIYVGFPQKELFKKRSELCWKREKALCKKKGYKKELV
jgi:hypothetical protein